MKKVALVLGVVVILLTAGLTGCITSAAPAAAPASNVVVSPSQQTGLWVTGEGKVSVAPDVAIINLGIDAQAKTVAEAQTQATDAMNKIMKALTGNGIKDKDIQTQRFSITQVTRWNKDLNKEEVIGYRVSNMVIAKIRDLNKTGSIIDAVATAGGDLTRIQRIGFTIDDPTPYYKEARDKAVADAVARAKQMATGADIKLGKVTYISEGSLYVPPPRYEVFDGMAKAAPAPMPAPTPVSPGELEVKLTVQMVYEIR